MEEESADEAAEAAAGAAAAATTPILDNENVIAASTKSFDLLETTIKTSNDGNGISLFSFATKTPQKQQQQQQQQQEPTEQHQHQHQAEQKNNDNNHNNDEEEEVLITFLTTRTASTKSWPNKMKDCGSCKIKDKRIKLLENELKCSRLLLSLQQNPLQESSSTSSSSTHPLHQEQPIQVRSRAFDFDLDFHFASQDASSEPSTPLIQNNTTSTNNNKHPQQSQTAQQQDITSVNSTPESIQVKSRGFDFSQQQQQQGHDIDSDSDDRLDEEEPVVAKSRGFDISSFNPHYSSSSPAPHQVTNTQQSRRQQPQNYDNDGDSSTNTNINERNQVAGETSMEAHTLDDLYQDNRSPDPQAVASSVSVSSAPPFAVDISITNDNANDDENYVNEEEEEEDGTSEFKIQSRGFLSYPLERDPNTTPEPLSLKSKGVGPFSSGTTSKPSHVIPSQSNNEENNSVPEPREQALSDQVKASQAEQAKLQLKLQKAEAALSLAKEVSKTQEFQLSKNVQEQQQENDSLKEKLSTMQQQLESEKADANKAIQQAIADKDAVEITAKESLEKLSEQVSQLEKELIDEKRRQAELVAEIELEKQVRSKSQQHLQHQHKEATKKLQDTIDQQQCRYELLLQDLKVSQEQLSTVRQQNEQQLELVQKQTEDRISQLNADKDDSIKKAIAVAKAEGTKEAQEIARIEITNETMAKSAALEELAALKVELVRMHREQEDLTAQLKKTTDEKMEAQLENVLHQEESTRELQNKLDAANAQIAELGLKIGDVNSAFAKMTQDHSQYKTNIQSEFQKLQQEKLSLLDEARSLAKAEGKQEAEVAAALRLETEINARQSLEAKVSHLTNALEEERQTRKDLEAQLHSEKEARAKVEKESAKAIQEANHKVAMLETKLLNSENFHLQAKTELNLRIQQLESRHGKVIATKSDVEINSRGALQEEMSKLTCALHEETKARKELESQLDSQKKIRAQIEHEATRQQQQITEAANRKCAELETKLQNHEASHLQANTSVDQDFKNRVVADADNRIRKLEAEHSDALQEAKTSSEAMGRQQAQEEAATKLATEVDARIALLKEVSHLTRALSTQTKLCQHLEAKLVNEKAVQTTGNENETRTQQRQEEDTDEEIRKYVELEARLQAAEMSLLQSREQAEARFQQLEADQEKALTMAKASAKAEGRKQATEAAAQLLAAREDERDKLTNEVTELKIELDTKRNKLKDLQVQLESEKEARVKAVKASIQMEQKAIEEGNQKYAELEKKLQESETNLFQARAETEVRFRELEGSRSKLFEEARAAAVAKERKKMEDEFLVKLAAERSERERLAKEVELLKNELEELRQNNFLIDDDDNNNKVRDRGLTIDTIDTSDNKSRDQTVFHDPMTSTPTSTGKVLPSVVSSDVSDCSDFLDGIDTQPRDLLYFGDDVGSQNTDCSMLNDGDLFGNKMFEEQQSYNMVTQETKNEKPAPVVSMSDNDDDDNDDGYEQQHEQQQPRADEEGGSPDQPGKQVFSDASTLSSKEGNNSMNKSFGNLKLVDISELEKVNDQRRVKRKEIYLDLHDQAGHQTKLKAQYSGPTDRHGRPHGMGTVWFPNGDMYLGEFKKGDMHGVGVFTHKVPHSRRSQVFHGSFDHNAFIGNDTSSGEMMKMPPVKPKRNKHRRHKKKRGHKEQEKSQTQQL